MPAGGAEPERLQDSSAISAGWTLGNRKVVMPPAWSREQLLQTGATVLDERAERDNLSALHIEKVGLDSLVGGDGESCERSQ